MEAFGDILKTLIAVVTALGGFEGVKYFYTRKATRQAANASAKSEEWNVAEKIQARYSSMLEDKNAKIEKLYVQIGELKEKVLTLTAENKDMQLTHKITLIQKCEKRGCLLREPPSDY